jgi:lipoate-protein ligase A
MMKYIKFEIHTGKENMQIDSDLLETAIKSHTKEPIIRLYGWSPKCVSLGRNQDEINLPVKIDVVRRVTGGRALLHDDEITYSYVTSISSIPEGESVSKSYKYISGILIDFFKTLGVDLEFGGNKKVSTKFDYCMLISTGADVCYHGKKVIGSAQLRKNGYILQHGSILFGYDKTLLEKLFNEKVSPESITTVKEILPNMTKEIFVKKFEEYIKTRN